MTRAADNALSLGLRGPNLLGRFRAASGGRFGDNDEFLISVAKSLDAALVAFSLIAVYVAYVGWRADTLLFYGVAAAMSVCLTLTMFRWFRLYDIDSLVSRTALLSKLVRAHALSAVVLSGTLFALKVQDDFSRVWLGSSQVLAFALVCGMRELLLAPIRTRARSGDALRKVALVGAGPQAWRLIESFASSHLPLRKVVGVFDDRTTRLPPEAGKDGVIGDLDGLTAWVRRNMVDEVIVTLPLSAGTRINEILARLRSLPVHVYLGADLVGHGFAPRHLVWVGEVPVLEIDRKPFSGWDGITKTLIDKVLAAGLLLLAAPAMAAIALLVRWDSPGPALFQQQRYGLNNELITVLKFRTMRVAATRDAEVVQARRDDRRVTRVGAWLRRSSLDELPQLLNVLAGSMSLVGPRPHAVQHNELFATLIKGYDARHKVKPGMTGWAQINGLRGETDTIEKIRARVSHDLFYIENWSFWLDIKILVATLLFCWRQQNAY